jgi:hypothetical protein
MSLAQFNSRFVNPLVKKLALERRKSIEQQQGQVVVLPDLSAVAQAIKVYFPEIEFTNEQAKIALEVGRKKAHELEKAFMSSKKRDKHVPPMQRYNQIKKAIPSIKEWAQFTPGVDLFIVTSFKRSVTSIIDAIIDSIQAQGILNEAQGTEVKSHIQRGHGVSGYAVSQVQIAGSIGALAKKITPKDLDTFKGTLEALCTMGEISYRDFLQLESLFNKYEHIVSKEGKLKATYVSVITLQLDEHNTIVDRRDEVKLKTVYKNFIEEIAPQIINFKGSSTLKEKIEKVLVEASTPKGSKAAKVTSNPKLKAELKSSGRSTRIFDTMDKKIRTTYKSSKHDLRSTTTGRFISKEAAQSPINILNMINAKLPEVVARNMVFPRLVFRTGRFAGSTRATDIQKTPTGAMSIGYTYMRDPYTVFEMGLGRPPWATPDRDPRKLIDESIRAIAAYFIRDKFFTRRV